MGVQIFWYANIDHNSKSHIALTEHTTTFCKMISINVKNSIKIKSKNIFHEESETGAFTNWPSYFFQCLRCSEMY